ncbi:NAD(P)H-dependent oxidoreductase [Actinokineospora sp. PR83]|uniref:NADPH-dependent FMN reductase n=1 Tax=Actinokineospora sp. PR83 TaxID=2884908 RepID=UPI001F1F7ACA|nr:NAD(P)H-dependent oxidoreductase [Actinokineospora sp. PR83]MCG8916933.1 NAD(P)H-dependent oxidoreductase [Actinokineospora sp. PR83]
MTRIAIIIGSTRPGRKGEAVARWVHKLASQRGDATFDVVDLADFNLPNLDEPVPAAMGSDYVQEHTRRWAETVASYDGYIFVTPEYNHAVTGVLKNAIDFLYHEWRDKAAGFVGYGLLGATRAVEQLRLIMAELHVADVRDQIALSMFTDFVNGVDLAPGDHHEPVLERMLDQVVAWSEAFAPLREQSA